MINQHADTPLPPSTRITADVTAWPGVRASTGSRGEWAFRLGRRELGHLHGDHVLHITFPKTIWENLRAESRLEDHPIFPGQPGYAARRINNEADIRDVVALLRPQLRTRRRTPRRTRRGVTSWEDKISRDHRLYRRDVGPSRWLMVVVSDEPEPVRTVAALAKPEGSQAMEAVNVRIGLSVFDHAG